MLVGKGEVRVWDLETLELRHTIRPPEGKVVLALVAVEGAVWVGAGRDVVEWEVGA
jgi:hypothetical protein